MTTKIGLLIRANPEEGESEVESFEFEEGTFLKTAYELMDATTIGALDIPVIQASMWYDDEYLYRRTEANLNYIATAMHNVATGTEHPVLGNVVVTGMPDDEGHTMGLSAEAIISIAGLHATLDIQREARKANIIERM